MNNALAYFGGFLVVVFAALFAVPAMIDWNGYRGVFEEEASKVLGRDVRVGGGVNLRLLPTPYVKFEKVRLADVSGQTGEPFIRVESFTMRLSGPALLRGVFEATDIELNKPVLTLALDGTGGGNWGSISLNPGALPFVPRDVTLRSVRLIDGAVSVYAPDAASVTRIDAINGELSADGLKGPFRFKGAGQWSGAQREIRFATTALDSDGGFRIKAGTNALATGNTFALDARIDGFATAPKIEGDLTGKLVVPGAAGSDLPQTMDFKSTITADAAGAALSDIALSLESAAEPQIVNGSASATWLGASRLDVALTSKWLDLDRLAGAGQDSAPFQKIQKLALGVIGAVAGDGAAGARIDVEQIKIGGETAGGLKIDAERRDGAVQIKEMRAGLPGGSRLGLTGIVKSNEAGALNFAGEGFVSGTSLARLKGWAEKSGATIDIGPDGVFSAEGKVRISGQRFEVTEASAEIGGRAMTGEVKIIDDGRRRAEITIESAEIERSDLFPKITKALEAAVRRAVGVAGAEPAPSARGDNMDISLRVLAGRLKRGGDTYRDVDATVALEKGNIRIPSAKFTTEGGLKVAVDGRIDDKNGAPSGVVSFDATGESPAAMRDLVRTFGLDGLIPLDRAERFGSAKLAGLVRLGGRNPASSDVSVDGLLAGARISAFGAFDAGLATWRTQQSQVRVNLQASSIGDLASALGAAVKSNGQTQDRAVNLALTASGAIEKGAAARIDVTANGLAIGYDGTLGWADGKSIDANGRMTVAARDIGDALALSGVRHASGLKAVALNGAIDVERQDGEWALSSRNLALGGSSLKGALTMATASDGASVIAGQVATDHLVIASVLAPFIEASAAAPGQVTGSVSVTPDIGIEDQPRGPVWPDGRFDFSALDKLGGEIGVAYDRLTISDGLQSRSGQLTLTLAPGKLEFTKLSGDVAGGQLSGEIALQATPGGVAGAAKLAIAGVELSKLGTSARGKADLGISLDGKALSPIALMASLAGAGKLTLDGARVAGPTQDTARAIVDDALRAKFANDLTAVDNALKDGLSRSTADLGSRSVDIKVVNGVASLAPITLESDAGSATAAAFLDLNSWSVASLWKVAPVPSPPTSSGDWPPGWSPSSPKGPLPSLSLETTGRLDDLAAVTSTIEATSLQRELAARQLERNVEELERLRRTDEERVRQERERRRLLMEQKAQAAAEARARRNGERLPPVVPESLNAPSQAPSQLPPADAPQAGADPAATSAPPPAEAAAAPASGEALGDQTSPATADGAPLPAATDPLLGEPPKPIVRPRPPRRAEPRRTSSDEVMRSLGGYP